MPRSAATDKRQELIEIASKLFYEQGYGATGIKQVIEEAEIAKGTFYSHFRSKEDLGLAWLKARHLYWSELLEERIGNLEGAAAKLGACFEFLREWMQDCGYRGCAFINTMAETPQADSPMRAEVSAHKLGLRRKFEGLAIEHFTELSEEAARSKGRFLLVLFEGALVEAQLTRELWPIDAAIQEVRSQLGSTT